MPISIFALTQKISDGDSTFENLDHMHMSANGRYIVFESDTDGIVP